MKRIKLGIVCERGCSFAPHKHRIQELINTIKRKHNVSDYAIMLVMPYDSPIGILKWLRNTNYSYELTSLDHTSFRKNETSKIIKKSDYVSLLYPQKHELGYKYISYCRKYQTKFNIIK